jgi:hypothetical protein
LNQSLTHSDLLHHPSHTTSSRTSRPEQGHEPLVHNFISHINPGQSPFSANPSRTTTPRYLVKMAFYDSSNTNNNASASTSAHLPHLAPQGDLTISQDAPEVSLNFTEAQVEEYKEQDRFLPVRPLYTFFIPPALLRGGGGSRDG